MVLLLQLWLLIEWQETKVIKKVCMIVEGLSNYKNKNRSCLECRRTLKKSLIFGIIIKDYS